MNERFCPAGNHMKKESLFRRHASGALHKFCIACEDIRRARARGALPAPSSAGPQTALVATREFPGVDIDAIHYKRGAIKPRKAA